MDWDKAFLRMEYFYSVFLILLFSSVFSILTKIIKQSSIWVLILISSDIYLKGLMSEVISFFHRKTSFNWLCHRPSEMETVEISAQTVNPFQEKVKPQDFELLKTLGRGGYGKVGIFLFASSFVYMCMLLRESPAKVASGEIVFVRGWFTYKNNQFISLQ